MSADKHVLAVLVGCAAVVGIILFSHHGAQALSVATRPVVTAPTSSIAGTTTPSSQFYDPRGPLSHSTLHSLPQQKDSNIQVTSVVGLSVAAFMAAVGLVSSVLRSRQPLLSVESVAMVAAASKKVKPAVSGEERLLWLPGAEVPEWLTNEYTGDRGFDPLGFGKNPDALARNRVCEVFHGRLAMLGVVGCLVPELLGKAPWNNAFEREPDAVVVTTALIALTTVTAPLEIWRWNANFSGKKDASKDPNYPGFDPFGLFSEEAKLKEIKNGRLAMVAILGFAVQSAVTGASPLENLATATNSVGMFATAGQKRPMWFPNAEAPEWLTGEYPGDRGFDPAGLARDPKDFAKFRDSEVIHGRWAMLGIVGCLVPEVLSGFGLPAWYEAGGAVFNGGIDYLGNPNLIHAQNASLILFTTLLFMGPVEAWRWNGALASEAKTGERTTYPGGPFDPLKLDSPQMRVKEIKNGRLAMAGIAGFWAQAFYTGQGPLANLAAHLANPFGANITSTVAMY